MRKSLFIILVPFVGTTLILFQNGGVPHLVTSLPASSSIYQGDLVLKGNNVTVIEGTFDINGSIIVEGNATLIFRNTIVNFTSEADWQFSTILQNPVNGNPHLIIDNATVSSNHQHMMLIYDNSSVKMNGLTTSPFIRLLPYDHSTIDLTNSLFYGYEVHGYDSSRLRIVNCTLQRLYGERDSRIEVRDSVINNSLVTVGNSVNCTITRLHPDYINYWNFESNCSASVGSDFPMPNITIIETEILGWGFHFGRSTNATIFDSEIKNIWIHNFGSAWINNCIIFGTLNSYEDSRIFANDSIIDMLYPRHNSKMHLVNTTAGTFLIHDQSEVYTNWILGVHVVDSMDQDVPGASVTAVYPNTTIAGLGVTDDGGQASLTLMEKMSNAAGHNPIGPYGLTASYSSYSVDTTVEMMGNQETTLKLEGLVIPEFSAFPSFLIMILVVFNRLANVVLPRTLSRLLIQRTGFTV